MDSRTPSPDYARFSGPKEPVLSPYITPLYLSTEVFRLHKHVELAVEVLYQQ